MRAQFGTVLATALLLAACGSDDGPTGIGPIEPDAQRDGDAEAGYTALVNEGYVGCGVPYSAYEQVAGGTAVPAQLLLPGRNDVNADLPYLMTRFTASDGVDVVSPNCLQCHAELLNGELVIGLGNTTIDYTTNIGTYALLAGGLVKDPVEKVHWERWKDRMVAISEYIVMDTVGVNPADQLAAVLFAHRDPDTLEWSDEPRIELPPPTVVPVDVPPWWNMKKKNAMFYLAAGRGDHARIMMTASTLCVETVEEAEAVDAYFPDVRSYIMSLEAPAWPWDVDGALVDRGREVFEDTCTRCHGTYGAGGDYPNLVVALDEVDTDDALAHGTAQFAGELVDWFNESYYGEIAELAPADGYIAPPLDGVWATAPYLHNGSVPTLAALLDSGARPTYWTRTFDTSDYDVEAVGWRWTPTSSREDEPDVERHKLIYDTTRMGYGNGGHTYGDGLTAEDRAALLEYLKTL